MASSILRALIPFWGPHPQDLVNPDPDHFPGSHLLMLEVWASTYELRRHGGRMQTVCLDHLHVEGAPETHRQIAACAGFGFEVKYMHSREISETTGNESTSHQRTMGLGPRPCTEPLRVSPPSLWPHHTSRHQHSHPLPGSSASGLKSPPPEGQLPQFRATW